MLTNADFFVKIAFVVERTSQPAAVAQSVERRIGSAEVTGPIPVSSLIKRAETLMNSRFPFFLHIDQFCFPQSCQALSSHIDSRVHFHDSFSGELLGMVFGTSSVSPASHALKATASSASQAYHPCLFSIVPYLISRLHRVTVAAMNFGIADAALLFHTAGCL